MQRELMKKAILVKFSFLGLTSPELRWGKAKEARGKVQVRRRGIRPSSRLMDNDTGDTQEELLNILVFYRN